jgi:hypothetical protein
MTLAAGTTAEFPIYVTNTGGAPISFSTATEFLINVYTVSSKSNISTKSLSNEIDDIDERYEEQYTIVREMKNYIDNSNYKSDSAMSTIAAVVEKLQIMELEDDGADEDDEYMEYIQNYLEEIEEIDLNPIDEAWEMKGNMSANLKRLFGYSSSNSKYRPISGIR